MDIAELIPTMDDASLASLRSNASRIEGGNDSARQKKAARLMPLIEAELATRAAAKPKPVAAPRKRAVKKAVAEAE